MIGSYGTTIERGGSYGMFSNILKYVAHLSGTQYWIMDEPITIPANTDFTIEFDISGESDAFEGLLDTVGVDNFWFRIMPISQNSNFQGFVSGMYLVAIPHSDMNVTDGIRRRLTLDCVGNQLTVSIGGFTSIVTVSRSEPISINRLGRYSTSEFVGDLSNFTLHVDSVLIYKNTLTNKEQGSIQVPSIGVGTMTMVNYTETTWRLL